jgi:hypothetical protein
MGCGQADRLLSVAKSLVYDFAARGRSTDRRIPLPPGMLAPRFLALAGMAAFMMSDGCKSESAIAKSQMLSVWLDAFGSLLERLHDLFAEPGFENDAFRAAVKGNRDDFRELFSSAEVGGQKDETNGLSAWAGERQRYVIELTALATFVSKFNKLSGNHLFELASKLSDLDKGHDHLLFEPAKVGDRHRDRSSLWRSRARIVLAVEALIANGTMPRKAEEEVANRLGQDLFAYAGKRAVKTKPLEILRNWRKALRNKRVSDLEGQLTFNEGLAKIKTAIANGDRAAIENVVNGVAASAATGGVLSPHFLHR